MVRKMLVAVLALVCAASLCYAAEEASTAGEPVSAAVEATGTFIGKVVSVVTEGTADTVKGTGTGAVAVTDETGKVMTFPVDSTVKIVDTTMNTVPLKQLKEGVKVSVDYMTGKDGTEKTKSITVNE